MYYSGMELLGGIMHCYSFCLWCTEERLLSVSLQSFWIVVLELFVTVIAVDMQNILYLSRIDRAPQDQV